MLIPVASPVVSYSCRRPLVGFTASSSGRTTPSASSSSRSTRLTIECSSTSGRRGRKAKQPGQFEIRVITPPPRSLGIHALPPLTHNGEEIIIEGEGYVVSSLAIRCKLVNGKYVRDHHMLEVQPTGRWFVNQLLESCMVKGGSAPQ